MSSGQRPSGARLMYAASERSADLLYATRFFAPDEFIYLEHGGHRTIVLSDLEFDRGSRDAAVTEVLSWSRLRETIRKRTGMRSPGEADLIAELLRCRRLRRATVPWDFPSGLAKALLSKGVQVRPVKAFHPARAVKSAEEIRHVQRAVRQAEAALLRAFEVLRATQIRRSRELTWGGEALTSERLRMEMEFAAAREGGRCEGTIVAGGRQAVDPHERGSGPLRGGEAIILDVFPRDVISGYYGDLTRTVVRGRAPDALRALWETVKSAQEAAVRAVRPGARGMAIHRGVQEEFRRAGYETGESNGRRVGFFHGTGHGLGLELHEEPRLQQATLVPGNVFTIEPGLYYPEIGGVRIEDDVLVTGRGRRVLGAGLPTIFEL